MLQCSRVIGCQNCCDWRTEQSIVLVCNYPDYLGWSDWCFSAVSVRSCGASVCGVCGLVDSFFLCISSFFFVYFPFFCVFSIFFLMYSQCLSDETLWNSATYWLSVFVFATVFRGDCYVLVVFSVLLLLSLVCILFFAFTFFSSIHFPSWQLLLSCKHNGNQCGGLPFSLSRASLFISLPRRPHNLPLFSFTSE